MRCPRCGNDNPDSMRFCGMCGGTLLSPAPPASRPERGSSAAPQSSAPATATATRPSAPTQEPRSDSSPSISGPSFLGLNDPPTSRKRANLNVDPHHSGRRNLDYLLEDDDHHHDGGGGAGKFFLMVLALLLAVGLGYLRWKNQLPPWLNSIAKKPAATTQTSEQPPADTSAPSSPPSITPEPQSATNQPAASQPVANTPSANPPAGNQPAANQTAPSNSAATPAANSQPPAEAAPKNDSANPPDNTAATKTPPPAPAETENKNNAPAAKSDRASDDGDSSDEPPSKPKSAPTPVAKPRATIRPVDSIPEARKYLYGKGASQDCDRGLRLLKPMANEGNPKAMVEMGALYSAGLCTPRDLPTSYRWFAMALRKDPSNETIQADLQKLWGEMTQPERQLAIKLTQ